MDQLKSLSDIFHNKIFRIPDYQRGYAWQERQYKDFFQDLTNLAPEQLHYTGVLTFKKMSDVDARKDPDYRLSTATSHNFFHVVDGQQRLTTAVLLISAFVEFYSGLESEQKTEVNIRGYVTIPGVIASYLYIHNPSAETPKAYKFGYEIDSASNKCLKSIIHNAAMDAGFEPTVYTRNLEDAQRYFKEKICDLNRKHGKDYIDELFSALTSRMLFNVYTIEDNFDIHVAFETMNHRGKPLSTLELLKNRLLYLTTLFPEQTLNKEDAATLKHAINHAWREIYYQLGRDAEKLLKDDDFLKDHCIMNFPEYVREGDPFSEILLEQVFSAERLKNDQLTPADIRSYAQSIKETVEKWFFTHSPYKAAALAPAEQSALSRLNRIGIRYFRPLVVTILIKVKEEKTRLELFKKIERTIFLAFVLCQSRSDNKKKVFWELAGNFSQGKRDARAIEDELDRFIKNYRVAEKELKHSMFQDYLGKLFAERINPGYDGWKALHYFLYEYELFLYEHALSLKPIDADEVIRWKDLRGTSKGKIRIEHILPQTLTKSYLNHAHLKRNWEERYKYFAHSLGNLVLLAEPIAQQDEDADFDTKLRRYKGDNGRRVSFSEAEIAREREWNPEQIEKRGMKMLNFMEQRWDFTFKSDAVKRKLLFIDDKTIEKLRS